MNAPAGVDAPRETAGGSHRPRRNTAEARMKRNDSESLLREKKKFHKRVEGYEEMKCY